MGMKRSSLSKLTFLCNRKMDNRILQKAGLTNIYFVGGKKRISSLFFNILQEIEDITASPLL